MAAIIFTSASSLRAHHAHGAVNWQVVKHITPGIIIGTLGGATLVGMLPSRVLSIIFVVFIFYAATQMLLKIAPKPSRKLPGGPSMLRHRWRHWRSFELRRYRRRPADDPISDPLQRATAAGYRYRGRGGFSHRYGRRYWICP